MSKIIEYTVAGYENTVGLVDEVNDLIAEGWQPLGGVSLVRNELDVFENIAMYTQAMVRYEKEPKTQTGTTNPTTGLNGSSKYWNKVVGKGHSYGAGV